MDQDILKATRSMMRMEMQMVITTERNKILLLKNLPGGAAIRRPSHKMLSKQLRIRKSSAISTMTVTIFFLSHVFFLVSVVRYPYFRFAPSHEETHHYLLTFPSYSSSFIIPL